MKKDYREKVVMGMVSNGKQFMKCPIVVRMTSDEKGQSLSLSAAEEFLLCITLEDVKDIIKVVEK